MRYKLSAPATLHTTVQLPASKSISNRALILHALAQGHITPTNLSDCDDTCVMIKALDGNPEHIDILAAGTAMRFLTAYLSVTPGTRIITGTERMQQRPIRILVEVLFKQPFIYFEKSSVRKPPTGVPFFRPWVGEVQIYNVYRVVRTDFRQRGGVRQ